MIAVREFAKLLAQHNVQSIREDEKELVTTMDMHISVNYGTVEVVFHDAQEKRRELTLVGCLERIAAEVARLHSQAYPLHSCFGVC